MASGSRFHAILTAVAATLNADADLTSRVFKVRKKPYNRGSTWLPGAFVTPAPRGVTSPFNTVQEDELVFPCNVVIVNPSDSDLTSGMESHMAHIERVEEIFRNKSAAFLPATMRALNATFDTATTAGKYAKTVLQMTQVMPDKTFVDPAFEAGFDASGCLVFVRVTALRFNSSSL